MSDPPPHILVERDLSPARRTELGVDAWPLWKDAVGSRSLTLDACEHSYLLEGSVTLTPENGTAVTVGRGDLVTIPPGRCLWEVHATVRRRYRSEALTPACCII